MTPRPAFDDSGLRAARARGFTLIELAVIVAIMGILLSLAAPSFSELVAAQRIRLTASDLYSSLIMARSEAMKRNVSATVTATGGDWQNGWTAQASGTTLQTQAAPSGGTTVSGSVATVTYAYTGRPLAASVGAAFTVASTGSSAPARCITLSLSGMPQLKTDTDGDPSNGC